jgi:rod shape determining protein RodA
LIRIDRRLLENLDWFLLTAVAVILALSAVSLGSLGGGRASGSLAFRQLLWVGVGLVVLIGVASVDYRNLVRAGPALYLLAIAGLLSVFVLGRTVAGARRWIHVAGFSVQPSELFKIAFVLVAIWALTARWAQPLGGGAVGLVSLLLGVPFLLILKQPDLGTALVLLPITAALLVAAGIRFRLLGALLLTGLASLPLAWFALKDYQRERIMVYLDPFRDPLGTAYNVIQAKIAIGSGQLLGKGIAGATQSRLAFLPERHTDFIFAVFAEMWGFVGCLVLIACYALVLMRGFEIAVSARELPGRLVAVGATALLATQTLINLGMVTGLLPIVGIPLPLMSYGGSSMVASLMAVGLLLSVRMRQFA